MKPIEFVIHVGRSTVYEMLCEICGHKARLQVSRNIFPKCPKCHEGNKVEEVGLQSGDAKA